MERRGLSKQVGGCSQHRTKETQAPEIMQEKKGDLKAMNSVEDMRSFLSTFSMEKVFSLRLLLSAFWSKPDVRTLLKAV